MTAFEQPPSSGSPAEVYPPGVAPSAPATTVASAATATGTARAARPSADGLSLWSELLHTLLLTLAIFLGVRGVVQRYRVDGVSMEPTLHSGEYLWVNKAAYFHVDAGPLERLLPGTVQGSVRYIVRGPQRGDVAVFRPPQDTDRDFVKRVIGLPGDSILIRNGQVFVNGQHLDEPYIRFSAGYNYPTGGQPVTVPDGSYFVLGDNRPNSSDSHFGWFVPADNLVGQAWTSSWPSLPSLSLDLRPKSVAARG